MVNQSNPGDWGFTLSAADVADVLDEPLATVLDLIRMGTLPAVVWAPDVHGPLRVALRPDSVRDYAERREGDRLLADETLRIAGLRVLRAYLEARPPVGDYEVASRDGLPLWGSTKKGRALHVRPEAVAAWSEIAPALPAMSASALTGAFEGAGSMRVRGVVPWDGRGGEGKQRWGTWWRIPKSLHGRPDEDATARDAVLGVVAEGDRVTVRGGGRPMLVPGGEA